jgi:hypothetical protein
MICDQCGHRNADGSRFCANPECKAFLAWTGQHGTPPASPPVPEPAAPPPRQGDATRWGHDAGGHSDAAASMSLTDPALTVQPGETATTTVSVHNGGSQVEQFALTVLGPTERWAEIDPPVLVVYPDARGEAVIQWSPPREPTTVAGRAPFTVRAASILHRGLQVHASGALDVGEFRELTATLTPQTTSGRWETTHRIQLTNAGNVVETVQLTASDPAGRVRFSLPGGELPVPPGAQNLDMSVRPPIRFLGRPVSQPFQVLATPRPPSTPVRLDGTREIVPLIAGWIPKVVAGLVALGVAAAVFFIANPSQGDDDDKAGGPTGPSPGLTSAPTAAPSGQGPPPPVDNSPPADPSATPSSSSPASPDEVPWVVVGANGAMLSTSGAASVVPRIPGQFEITFTRTVAGCVYLATVAATGGQPVPDRGLVFTASGGSPNSVLVETREIDQTLHPYPFHLQVRCSTGDSAVVERDQVIRGNDDPRVKQTEDGQWEVRFGRDVRKCSYVATIGDPGPATPPTGVISVGSGQRDSRAVLIETRSRDGVRSDMPFHLQTRCSGLFAVVGVDGEAARKDGVKDVRHPDPGTWEVDFERDVSRCSYVAAVGSSDSTLVNIGGEVFAASGVQPATVQIQTRRLNADDGSGELADFPFHLQVVC